MLAGMMTMMILMDFAVSLPIACSLHHEVCIQMSCCDPTERSVCDSEERLVAVDGEKRMQLGSMSGSTTTARG
jgi:hypothetical protein